MPINKHIALHCVRLSFILLQDEDVEETSVALLLGPSSTRWVFEIYQRNRLTSQIEAINKLPSL